jgi:hypothetical protein
MFHVKLLVCNPNKMNFCKRNGVNEIFWRKMYENDCLFRRFIN